MPTHTPLSARGRLLASSQYHCGTNRLLTIEVDSTAHIYMMPVETWTVCEKTLAKDEIGDTWLQFTGYQVDTHSPLLGIPRFITSFQGVSRRNNEVSIES